LVVALAAGVFTRSWGWAAAAYTSHALADIVMSLSDE